MGEKGKRIINIGVVFIYFKFMKLWKGTGWNRCWYDIREKVFIVNIIV